jgi:hypothetical protein
MYDLDKAHSESSNHIDDIKASSICGCFYCMRMFKPSEIKEWIDDDTTALCPLCGIDSVIGSESGYPITKDFLKKMSEYWFRADVEFQMENGKIKKVREL